MDADVTRQHYDESSREVAERWTARLAAVEVLDRVLDGGEGGQVAPSSRHPLPEAPDVSD